jgi:hypothetical protein
MGNLRENELIEKDTEKLSETPVFQSTRVPFQLPGGQR